MLVSGDLGFRFVGVLVFVVFPAIFLFLRRQWRLAVARRDEINRLLVLASEEADQAELEASSIGFGFSFPTEVSDFVTVAAPVSLPQRLCAVCFTPTQNRCARCKSVHYCSGKCQIIHWRQGHKYECTPSSLSFEDENPINLSGNAAWHPHSDNYTGRTENDPIKSVEKDDNALKPGFINHVPSSSGPCQFVPDDVTCIESTSDDDNIHDVSSNLSNSTSSFGNLGAFVSNSNIEAVYDGNIFASSTPMEEVLDKKSASSSFNISHSNKKPVEPLQSSSDFLNGSHEYSRMSNDSRSSNAKQKLDSVQSSLDSPSKMSSSMYSQSIKASHHLHKADKLVEPVLSEKGSMNAAKHRTSTNLNPRRIETRVKKINVGEDLMKSDEVRSVVKTVKVNGNGAVIPLSMSSVSSAPGGVKTFVPKVVDQLKAPKLLKQVGKNIEKGVFPYELFVKLYHWNKVELRPCGLINCGNSCYANVVLQCLAFTPPLTAYILQGLHTKACVSKEWCLLCEFERLILKGKEGGSPISPIGILSHIQKIGSHLCNGREEDAHEFLRYATDIMQYVCLRESNVSGSSPLEEETTLMGLTFGGYLRSKIKCTRCHGKSEKHERMMDLSVEIGGDIVTLEDALRRFTGTESLDGENKYHCGRCKSYEKAKKKLSISEAPNVLTIALKRFQSGKFGKLNKSIRFPEILNLAPYMRGSSDKSPIYRLYGVVVHLDIMNASFSGHYVCYVRNTQNKWFKIDDSTVKVVESERVLNKGAYMLFYSRCSPRAPKSIRSNIISRDPENKIKNPQVNPCVTHARNTSRHRDLSLETNHRNDNMTNLSHIHQDKTKRVPHILEFDSYSDNSSLFSHSDDVSSNTDSTRESISADDISDYIFGWRPHSDSDSSSSSSSSSPLSYSKRYACNYSDVSGSRPPPCRTCVAEELGSSVGVQFLQSNSSEISRKVVNSSGNGSCRGVDPRIIGQRGNPLDNMMASVRLGKKTG